MVFFVALLSLLLPTIAFGQDSGFVPLVGIPYVDTTSQATTLGDYVNGLYWASISIAAVLAFLKITWAGIKYMMSEIVTDKQSAKSDIKGALLGLIIILAAVLILDTINPTIKNLEALDLVKLTGDVTQPVVEETGIDIEFEDEVLGSSINWDDASVSTREAFIAECLPAFVNITPNAAGVNIATCVANEYVPVDPDLVAATSFSTDLDSIVLTFEERVVDQISSDLGVQLYPADLKGYTSVPIEDIPGNDEIAFAVTLQTACEEVDGSHIGITLYGGNYEFWCVGNTVGSP